MTKQSPHRNILMLMCAAIDKTWQWSSNNWQGKCIHCNRRLIINHDGRSDTDATLEHITPRTHGGTDELDNLTIACGRCNHQKGRTIDILSSQDVRYLNVIDYLTQKKESRLRPPHERCAHLFNRFFDS